MCHDYAGVPCGTGIDNSCGSRCSAIFNQPLTVACPQQLVRERFVCTIACLSTCSVNANTDANIHQPACRFGTAGTIYVLRSFCGTRLATMAKRRQAVISTV